jgi:hypothetical protein
MKRLSLITAVLVVGTGLAASASAQGIDLKGPHYNLNILGKEHDKTATMTGSNRHTIFVALGKNAEVTSRIYLTPGPFEVCDGNAFDAAHDCTGAVVQEKGAVFQLPCNTAVPAETTACAEGTASASYAIWGRALGKPGGSVTMTTCGTAIDPITLQPELVCDTDNGFTFERKKGKSMFFNVTKELTTVNACFNVGTTTEFCQRLSLFDPMLQDYFWQYANKGLRHLQLRFYPI